MIVRVLDAANDDLYSAASRLEARQSGVGIRLIREYKVALERMESQPFLNPPVDVPIPFRDIRNALVLRATYRIIYEVRPAECIVLSVIDTRRRPGTWHSRISDA